MAETPRPPYYAVIFTSIRGEEDGAYSKMAEKMFLLAKGYDGFLGVESAREGVGISVSYWADLSSIEAWKKDAEHRVAQRLGKEVWYTQYRIRIAKVEREDRWP